MPCWASTSAAIRPAGPPLTMIQEEWVMRSGTGCLFRVNLAWAWFLQQGLEIGQAILRRNLFFFCRYGVADVEAHFVNEARHVASYIFTCAFATLAPGHMQ